MSSLQQQVSANEWAARCQLAALYRLIAYYRMTDLIDTHISLRVPNEEGHFLINQYGIPFEKMTASHLVKIDYDGNIIDEHDQGKMVNVAGFVIHSAIHSARQDLHCVIHTHTADGIAVSAQKQGLLPISQHALKFYNKISYHDYEGVALLTEERERLVQDFGQNRVMILRNHGLLTCGATVAEAFNLMLWLETACKAQVDTLAMGREIIVPDEVVLNRTARLYDPDVRKFGQLEWEAMLRLLDREDSSYRD